MKIERVNDHQIRCTLTREDLADRELKLSELAYGTEKAKSLFRDMMQQASYEFGFEAEDIPLMIEAIPLSSECIILIITKVEDPEELDTRFSKFAPSVHDENGDFEDMMESLAEGADEVLDLFKKIQSTHLSDLPETDETLSSTKSKSLDRSRLPDKRITTPASHDLTRIYSFDSLHIVIRLSRVLVNSFQGVNSLYKRPRDERFVLVITKGYISPGSFNKVCNVLSEYGTPEKTVYASEAYLEEHFEPLIRNNAIQELAQI
ncbi:MAG: adaptor protein MecA [Lachnospiraceae bacterium]|nr:adaptor protein MecA [Lachnospiraceae bacterium]